jgi:hypothetical protein
MPRATVSLAPQRFDLKTLPPQGDEEGGWVQMRRMSYGELLQSQDMAYQVQMKAAEGEDDPEVGVSITRAAIAEFQLKTCVLDHNLEDETGRKLVFSNNDDVVSLDASVGQELSDLIDKMHDWSKNFPNSKGPSANGSSTGRSTVTEASDSPTSTDETSQQKQPQDVTSTS